MRLLIVALLLAISYAQTGTNRLQNIRLLPMGVPEAMPRDELTSLIAAGLDMNTLWTPRTQIREQDRWMYGPNAMQLARQQKPEATYGIYPLGQDADELKMWDWLKTNGYVRSHQHRQRLLNQERQHMKKQTLQAPRYGGFPEMEMDSFYPYMSQIAGSAGYQMPYGMEEEMLPYYFSNLYQQATPEQQHTASTVAASAANKAQAAMIMAKWGGEDYQQYNAYLQGMTIDGVDNAELQQYQQVAQLQGHDISKLPTMPGMYGGMMGGYGYGFGQTASSASSSSSSGSSSSGSTSSSSGSTSSSSGVTSGSSSETPNGFNTPGIAGIPSSSSHSSIVTPSSVHDAISYMPAMFMEPEDMTQYMMYKSGLYNSNMDLEELIRYQSWDQMSGGHAAHPTSSYGGASSMKLNKAHQFNPMMAAMEGEEAIPYLIAANQQGSSTSSAESTTEVGSSGSTLGGLSPWAMAMMMNGESGLGEGDIMPGMIPGLINSFSQGGGMGTGGLGALAMGLMGDGLPDAFDNLFEGPMGMGMIPGLVNYFNQNPVNGLSGDTMAGMGMAAMSMFGDGIDKDMLPYMMGMAGGGGLGGMASMIPTMLFDGEDMQQYIQFIHGMVTPDMDVSEIARYRAMAQQQGIHIPSSPTSIPGVASAFPTAGLSAANLLTGEKAHEYNLFVNGIMTSNMDPSEIAMYQQIAQASGVTPKSYTYMPTAGAAVLNAPRFQHPNFKLNHVHQTIPMFTQQPPQQTSPQQMTADMMEDYMESMRERAEMYHPTTHGAAQTPTAPTAHSPMTVPTSGTIPSYAHYTSDYLEDMIEAQQKAHAAHASAHMTVPTTPTSWGVPHMNPVMPHTPPVVPHTPPMSPTSNFNFRGDIGGYTGGFPSMHTLPGMSHEFMQDLYEDVTYRTDANGVRRMYSGMDGDSYIRAISLGMDPATLPLPSDGFSHTQMQQLYFIESQRNGTARFQFPAGFNTMQFGGYEAPEMEDMMGQYAYNYMHTHPGMTYHQMYNDASQYVAQYGVPGMNPGYEFEMPDYEDLIAYQNQYHPAHPIGDTGIPGPSPATSASGSSVVSSGTVSTGGTVTSGSTSGASSSGTTITYGVTSQQTPQRKQ